MKKKKPKFRSMELANGKKEVHPFPSESPSLPQSLLFNVASGGRGGALFVGAGGEGGFAKKQFPPEGVEGGGGVRPNKLFISSFHHKP